MSANDPGAPLAPEGAAAAQIRQVIGDWVDGLAAAIEAMTEKRPETRWESAGAPFAEAAAAAGLSDAEIFWWEQPFQPLPDAVAWVAAPRALSEAAGTLILNSAGLEKVEPGEARNTWLEVLGQSLSAMARSTGAVLSCEVTCQGGIERAPAADLSEWAVVHIALPGDPVPPLLMALSPQFAALLAAPAASEAADTQENLAAPPAETRATARAGQPSRTMELLLDVELPISISFGKAQLPLKDVLKLTTGSIVELNCGANEPVEVLVNHCLIARGEVVVVEGNYGVRIQQIATRLDRLRSVR